MRVLHICSYYATPLYRLLFDELNNLGIEQKVFYFASRDTRFDAPDPDVVFSPCYGDLERMFFLRKESKALSSLYSLVDVASYDIVHAHSLFSNGYLALEAKRKRGLPYIVAFRNTDLNAFFKVRPWLRRVGLEIMQEAESVIFLSPSYRDAVLSAYVPDGMRRAIEGKSCVIPNGINEVFFKNRPDAPRREDGVVRVVQVGDINSNKNQLTVAKACLELERSGSRVSYLIVGRAKSKSVVKKLNRYPFVKILPPVPQSDLIGMYRESDVFAMPSFHETFGLVYVEAMSQGLPVVYSKEQGFDGWVSDPELARGVVPSDKRALAAAIESLLPASKERLQRAISEATRFKWPAIAARYRSEYERALSQGNTRGHQLEGSGQ